jgi:hypothetical protein
MMAAQMDTVMSSNLPGIEVHGKSIRVAFMHKGVRHHHTLGIEPTNLTARGNLAFIANQMGHSDYSMLVKVYGRWIDSESPRELGRIWQGMKKLVQIAPNLPQ